MTRMSPAARREAIIDATLVVALRKGFASTTVRDVAGELGCSSGLIHHYFSSMDDVLAAAFERAAGRDLAGTEAAIEAAGTAATASVTATAAAQAVRSKLVAFFESYTRNDEDWAYQLWLDAWAEAVRRPALGATSRRLNVAWQQLLVRIIRDGITVGTFHCADPDASAWRVLSLIDGLTLQTVAHAATIDRATVLDWSMLSAEHELGLTMQSLPRPPVGPR
jgi:AcrR family transcriptional regulator